MLIGIQGVGSFVQILSDLGEVGSESGCGFAERFGIVRGDRFGGFRHGCGVLRAVAELINGFRGLIHTLGGEGLTDLKGFKREFGSLAVDFLVDRIDVVQEGVDRVGVVVVGVEEGEDWIRIFKKDELRAANVTTQVYPGFPTDMQPQIGVVLSLSSGTSIVTESIFENRFKYVDELARMGANIKVEGNTSIIDGVPQLTGARITSPDLRAGAALVIAALAAEGCTVIDDIVYIQRGYEDFEGKLRSLGAEIEKVSSEEEIRKFEFKVS